MKAEPLKNKKLEFDTDKETGKPLPKDQISGFYFHNDVKSAVEWLLSKRSDIKQIFENDKEELVIFYKKDFDEAFEDTERDR